MVGFMAEEKTERFFPLTYKVQMVVWIGAVAVMLLVRAENVLQKRFFLLLGLVTLAANLLRFLILRFSPKKRKHSEQLSPIGATFCGIGSTLYGLNSLYPLAIVFVLGGIALYGRDKTG